MAAFDPQIPAAILGHFDADGLSAAAILARALERSGRPATCDWSARGRTPGRRRLRGELAARRPGGLIVTDLGVREGAVLPGVPTVLIDHHVPTGAPGDAVVISGHGLEPGSLAPGRGAVESNTVIAERGWTALNEPLPISLKRWG